LPLNFSFFDGFLLMLELPAHLASFHHRLVTLERTLISEYAARRLPKKEYGRRILAIKGLQSELTRLATLYQCAQTKRSNEFDVKLSDIANSPEHELEVYGIFVQERTKLSNLITTELLNLAQWCDEAQANKVGWYRSTFRLSSLGKLVGKIGRWLYNLDDEHINIDRKIEELIQLGPASDTLAPRPSDIPQLIRCYDQLNHLSSSITELTKQISKETDQVLSMKNWLQKTKSRLAEELPTYSPPTATDTLATENELTSLTVDPLLKTRKRLALAEKYLSKTLRNSNCQIQSDDAPHIPENSNSAKNTETQPPPQEPAPLNDSKFLAREIH
jgi:hypothetical protein